MEYECITIPIIKFPFFNDKTIISLCDDCFVSDCSHIIERKKISILGITEDHKVIIKGGIVHFVVKCQGKV